jgi:tetratricopeptide (TPR) repeat protein
VAVRAREMLTPPASGDPDASERLDAAFDSPTPATAIGLRVTSYLAAAQDDRSVFKVVIAGEASRFRPGDATLRIVARDTGGRDVADGEQPLGKISGDLHTFSANLALEAGSYVIRVAIMDAAGRVGSVDHRLDVQPVSAGALSLMGPVLIRVSSDPSRNARVAIDSVQQDERLALQVDLAGAKDRVAAARITFEIATTEGLSLLKEPASISAGPRADAVVGQAIADLRLLPPGRYIVLAKVTAGDQTVGELRRGFALVAPPGVLDDRKGEPASGTARPSVARVPAGAIQAFTVEQVLAPPVIGRFLDKVAERPEASSPELRELLQRARTVGLRSLEVPDRPGDSSAALSFVKGLALLAGDQLDPAANAFRAAMRAAPDFYPAIVYLGACYAAGGHDKDAAGAWQTALIREGDALPLHAWLTDALLRQGEAGSALAAIEEARLRWPDDPALARRYVVASLFVGRTGQGLDALDRLIASKADDEPTLLYGLMTLYEAITDRREVENAEADRARMLRLADAYRARGGASQALVDTWVAAVSKGKF